MPADTSILMGFRGPQIESQDALNARAAQQLVAQQQNMLGAMQLGEMARANKQKQAVANALANIDPNTPSNELNKLLRNAYIKGGDLKGLMDFDRTAAEAEAAQAKVGKEKAQTTLAEQQAAKYKYELEKQRTDHGWEAIGNARNPQEYKDKIYDALSKKLISQAEADSGLARLEQVEVQDQIAGGNANYNKFRLDNLVQLVSLKDKIAREEPKYEYIDLGGKKERVQINPNAPGFNTTQTELTKTATIADTEKARHNKELEKIRRQELGIAYKRLKEDYSTGNLDPQTLDFAAQGYIQDKKLPELGSGKAASAIKTAILNRAAQITMGGGVSAADAASNVIGNKIDVATKTKATKDFSTGIQGRQVTAFNTAIDHLATMDKLSDALQNNDIKLINSLGNIVARQTGKPAPTNFDAAKQIVTAEVIKAVVASGGGVTERQEAERNFAAANSPAQLKGLVRTYKELLGGQLNSLGVQYESTTGKKDFESKLTPDAKTEFKAVRGKGQPTAAGAVDTNNKWLRSNP
jgi:hypothetical protein